MGLSLSKEQGDAKIVFADELALIRNQEIKNFVTDAFHDMCPLYFWTCAASTSGKYHPQISLGDGGLVRHTKLAVWWGVELVNAMTSTVTPHDRDIVVASLLLHDMWKNGNNVDILYTKDMVSSHGGVLAKALDSRIDEGSTMRICLNTITDCIQGHMGKWTHARYSHHQENTLPRLVHLADYAASRKVDDKINSLIKEKTDGN